MRMIDGFNEGWVEFRGGETGTRMGKITLEAALKKLLG
jgi:NAD(P)H dehydrogenase (quinone)